MTLPHEVHAFEAVSDSYRRGRPDYPVALAEWLVQRELLGPGRVVVDLGAGTGKLTGLLATTGARVIAVEPLAAMRAELEATLPDVESLDGQGESIPIADHVARLVTAALAFHWFANDVALTEIARVLEPDGSFVIVTTDYARSTPLQNRLVEMRSTAYKTVGTTPGNTRWRDVIDGDNRFAFVEEAHFFHEIYLDLAGLHDRLRSNSAIAALDDASRQAMFDEIATMIEDPSAIDVSQQVRALHYQRQDAASAVRP